MKVPVRYVVERRNGSKYVACYRADLPHVKVCELAVNRGESALKVAEWYREHKPEREV